MSNSFNREAKAFTKECVFLALINLLKEKTYESITLTEIAKKAGVSRNAIYRNFESKDLILKNYLNDISLKFIAELNEKLINSYYDYILSVFTHLCSHSKIAKILVFIAFAFLSFLLFCKGLCRPLLALPLYHISYKSVKTKTKNVIRFGNMQQNKWQKQHFEQIFKNPLSKHPKIFPALCLF